MKALFVSELQRFRRLALALGAGHLALLAALVAFDPFNPSPATRVAAPLLYGLGGLALGLYQFGSYRRLNPWTFLVHRPLAPGRIFLAVAGAGAVLLAAVVALPQVLLVAYVDLLTPVGLDGRQYLVVPYLLGHALAAYLGGAFLALAPFRGAVLVLVLGGLYLTREAPGATVLVPLGLVVAWLGFLAHRAFKPSLDRPLRGPWTVAAAGLPLAYGLFFLLVAGSAMVWQTWVIVQASGWRSYAVHSWNDHFPEGTVDHLDYRDPRQALAHGLARQEALEVAAPEADHLRRQVELAEVVEIAPAVRQAPRRHQPGFLDRGLSLVDPDHGVVWTFRHDRMRFLGRDVRSGDPVGWLGSAGGAQPRAEDVPPFAEVPRLVGEGQVATSRRLWVLDGDLERLLPRLALPAAEGGGGEAEGGAAMPEDGEAEALVSPLVDHGRFATVLTDHALHLVRSRDLERSPAEVAPFARVPLPAALADLQRVQVAELLDGYLVSFVTGRRSLREGGEARQVVGELRLDGTFRRIAERELAPSWPALYRHRGFVLSPLVQRLHDAGWALIRGGAGATGGAEGRREAVAALVRPVPAVVAGAAWLVGLLCAGVALVLGRRRELAGAALAAWVVAAAVGGLAALLAGALLTAPTEPVPATARSRRRVPVPAWFGRRSREAA